MLAHHADRTPDKAITVFEGETITYGEMADRVAALAGGLAERGVGPGDVVAILSYNCPEFLEALFAANHLGAIAMPINWRLAAPEVRYILEHSGARALVCDEALLELADEATEGWDAPRSGSCVSPAGAGRLDHPRRSAASPTGNGGRAGGRGRRPPADVHVGHDGTAQGRHAHARQPGVEEPGPHRRVRVHGRRPRPGLRPALPRRRARPDDDIADRRRRHDHHPPLLRAAAVVDEVERSRVTAVWLAPAMVNAIMALPDIEQRDLSSIRVVINGGEKMPIPFIQRIQRVFPSAWFADAYGMTETVSATPSSTATA